jgi:hypothetical protein
MTVIPCLRHECGVDLGIYHCLDALNRRETRRARIAITIERSYPHQRGNLLGGALSQFGTMH